jgi:hypothetical protein
LAATASSAFLRRAISATDISCRLSNSARAAPIPPLAPVITTIVSDMNSAYRLIIIGDATIEAVFRPRLGAVGLTRVVRAAMDAIPAQDRTFDMIVAQRRSRRDVGVEGASLFRRKPVAVVATRALDDYAHIPSCHPSLSCTVVTSSPQLLRLV